MRVRLIVSLRARGLGRKPILSMNGGEYFLGLRVPVGNPA
jgi:hypothetical protein